MLRTVTHMTVLSAACSKCIWYTQNSHNGQTYPYIANTVFEFICRWRVSRSLGPVAHCCIIVHKATYGRSLSTRSNAMSESQNCMHRKAKGNGRRDQPISTKDRTACTGRRPGASCPNGIRRYKHGVIISDALPCTVKCALDRLSLKVHVMVAI